MKRTLCTTGLAALLASVAIFASFDDAEARGRGGAGIHRMSARAHLSKQVNRTHFARSSIKAHGNARLRNATKPGIRHAATKPGIRHAATKPGLRHAATKPGLQHAATKPNMQHAAMKPGMQQAKMKPGIGHAATKPGMQQAAMKPNMQQAAMKQAAAATAKSGNLKYGPQKQEGRVYGQMAPGSTPTANNTPPNPQSTGPSTTSTGPSTTSTGPSTKSTGPQITTTQGGALIGLAILEALKDQPRVVGSPPVSTPRQDLIRRVWNTRFRHDWGEVTPQEVMQIKEETGASDDTEAWKKFINQNAGPQQ
jgi:hypothetical protein